MIFRYSLPIPVQLLFGMIVENYLLLLSRAQPINSSDLLNWIAPVKIQTEFPYYLSGYDYENRPVLVLPWGKWNGVKVVEEAGKDLEDATRNNDQLIERIRKNYFSKKLNESESGSNDDEIVIILDYDDFDIHQLQSQKHMVYLMNFFAKLESCYEKFAYGFIVNANSLVDQVINIGKAFMGQFLEKMEVYGTNSNKFIPQILKKIPRSQLHSAYGGYDFFQPVEFYG